GPLGVAGFLNGPQRARAPAQGIETTSDRAVEQLLPGDELAERIGDVNVVVVRHRHASVDLDPVFVGGVRQAVAEEVDDLLGLAAGREEHAALEAALGYLATAARE